MSSILVTVRAGKRALQAAPAILHHWNVQSRPAQTLSSSFCESVMPIQRQQSRSAQTLSSSFCESVMPIQRQQCRYKKKLKKGKKGSKNEVAIKIPYNHLPEVVDLVDLHGEMRGQLMEMQQVFFSISVNSNPAVLGSVHIRVGVEKLPITDMCLIAAEPGKPIILDCSIYPEHLTLIQEAINAKTAFSALPHGSRSLKLTPPNLTDQLRKQLVSQANTQKNEAIDNIRKLRNRASDDVTNYRSADNQKRNTKDAIHELFLHNKAEIERLFKEKKSSLMEQFDL